MQKQTTRAAMAPSRPVNVLLAVAEKTIRRNWRDLRFLVSTVLVLGVGVAAGLSSGKALDRARTTADSAAREARERSDLQRAVFVRTPSPWIFVREGGEHQLPDHLLVLPGFVDYPRTRLGQGVLGASRPLDWSFVVVYLLSLAAIITTFDLVSSERESGTLDALLAQPVPRWSIWAGFMLGSTASFVPLVGLSFLLNLNAVTRTSTVEWSTLDPWMLLGVFALSALLVVFMMLVGCLASTVATGSVGAGLLALLVWTAATILVPTAATLVAEVVHPTPSFRELEVEIDSARKRFLASTRPFSSMEIREIVDRRDLTTAQKRERLRKLQAEISAQHQRRLRRYKEEVMELRGRYIDSLTEQTELAESLSSLSPVAVFHAATEALVGTGMTHHRRFVQKAEELMAEYTRIAETARPTTESRIYGPVIEESGVELHAILWQSWRGAELETADRLEFREGPMEPPVAPQEALRGGALLLLLSVVVAASTLVAFP